MGMMYRRRQWLSSFSAATVTAALLPTPDAFAADGELPMALRSFTKLAPLSSSSKSSSTSSIIRVNNSNKSLHLPIAELAARLQRDLSNGATGQGSYIVTGDLSLNLFRDDCSFIDPTNRVDDLLQYQKALTILFDPATSKVDLLEPLRIVKDDHTTRTTTIVGRYRCRGTLKLPWKPVVAAFESDIVYHVDPATGLVSQQEQRWSKSAATALQETFTPSLFSPAPWSTLSKAENEPAVVTQLFDMTNGRRPSDYSAEERAEIDALIHRIATSVASQQQFEIESIYGTWRLVYLRPGPSGAGIDRRVPFPELPFNDNYQVFGRKGSKDDDTTTTTESSITNRGELFGPDLFLTVSGVLIDPDQRERTTATGAYKRLQADIQGGSLCWTPRFCVDLPITGTGLFDSVYVGDRLRIGQNVNGGGALVVQVRMK